MKISLKLLTVLSILLLAFNVSAASKRRSGGKSKMAFGFAHNAALLGLSGDTAFTGTFGLSKKAMVQAYFITMSSDPMTYSIGGAYKYTLKGNNEKGLHVGGGLGLGTLGTDQSFSNFGGLVGFHFTVAKKVRVHLDGGITIKNPPGGGDSQFVIGGHSALFGLSLLYKL